MAVEALINRFEEDQLKKEMHKEKQRSQSVHQFTDNCSDSDSSFNQVRNAIDTLGWKYTITFYLFIASKKIIHE